MAQQSNSRQLPFSWVHVMLIMYKAFSKQGGKRLDAKKKMNVRNLVKLLMVSREYSDQTGDYRNTG